MSVFGGIGAAFGGVAGLLSPQTNMTKYYWHKPDQSKMPKYWDNMLAQSLYSNLYWAQFGTSVTLDNPTQKIKIAAPAERMAICSSCGTTCSAAECTRCGSSDMVTSL